MFPNPQTSSAKSRESSQNTPNSATQAAPSSTAQQSERKSRESKRTRNPWRFQHSDCWNHINHRSLRATISLLLQSSRYRINRVARARAYEGLVSHSPAHYKGGPSAVSPIFNDPRAGPIRCLSRTEIRTQVNLKMLAAQGLDYHDLRCACCGLRLIDLSKITVSSRGAIGPECSKPGHVMPCRHQGDRNA